MSSIHVVDNIMDLRVFYGPKKYKMRFLPEYECEDSELGDSDGDDPKYVHFTFKETDRF